MPVISAFSRRFRPLSIALALGLSLDLFACTATNGSVSLQPEGGASAEQGDATASTVVERSLPEIGPDDKGTAVGIHGAVSSAEANATDIGLAVLKRGGNAIDAAIAVGFALSVTHPSAGNIGGGGFMVVRFPDGTSTAIDYREVAPGKSTEKMYVGPDGNVTNQSRVGPLAAGIPGDVAGFGYVHKKYGSLPWRELVMPSVELARNGVELDSFHADDLRYGASRMKKAGYPESAKQFLHPDGREYEAGEVWKQPFLANTLQTIADGGPESFYNGPLAQKMVEGVQKLGGIWTTEDLATYEAVERDPVKFDYHGYEIIAMPPPSAGGVVLRHLLAANQVLGLDKKPWHSIDQVHLYVEALRRTYADRNTLIGDPAFINIPMKELLDVGYMTKRMSDIKLDKATPSSEVGAGAQIKESEQTTHYSVVDDSGIAVANTYTLNGGFGAKVTIEGTGVILNNEMDDFTAKPGVPNMFGLVQGPQNAVAPGKRMLSSMTPTIVAKDGELRAIVGSPGGPTITTTVAQVIMQLLDHDVTLTEAIASPRIHHQWLPDRIMHEPGLPPALVQELEARGHELSERSRMGHCNAIEVDPKTKGYRAVADVVRDGGKAAAY